MERPGSADPTARRWPSAPGTARATIQAVRASPASAAHSLYRYPPGHDGLPGTEGAFLPGSFWLVQGRTSRCSADGGGDTARLSP
jgi:hypothetical protein